jgi:hypothetical protein
MLRRQRSLQRRFCLVALMLLVPAVARAQVPVIDALNLVETARTAYNTYQTYRKLVEQYELLVRMARRAAGMSRYRTPDVPVVFHDPGRYVAGAPFIRALNSGDPSGQGFDSVTRTPLRPEAVLSGLSAAARRDVERAFSTIDISDSVGALASNQIGHVRGFASSTTGAIRVLENDTLGGSDNEHYQTAILDRINAAQVIARRQDTSTNQLISHLVEQSLVQTKRERDTEAIVMGMRVRRLRYYREYSASFFTPTAQATAAAWRQP